MTFVIISGGIDLSVGVSFDFAAMAATAAGYERVHNVSHGFEGPIEAREFADWRMGFVDLNGVDVKNLPGFSDFLSDDVEPRRLLEELTQVKRLLLLFRAME